MTSDKKNSKGKTKSVKKVTKNHANSNCPCHWCSFQEHPELIKNENRQAKAEFFVNVLCGPGAAKLGIYSLSSGERLAMVDLTAAVENPPADARYFANDVTVSTAGTVFITDTRLSVIYKVDQYYQASVLIDFGMDSGLFLNGIEYHPAGYLIAVSSQGGELIKIPLNAPNRWSLVEVDFPATGGDGLVWANDGGLVSTSNNRSAVMKYRSDDHWNSARLTGMASFEGQGTTAAAVNDDIFVVQPHFADAEPPEILRVKF